MRLWTWVYKYLFEILFPILLCTYPEMEFLDHMLCYVVLSCSVMSDYVIPWTIALQAPLSTGILKAEIQEWVAMPSSRSSSQPRDQTQVSCIAGRFFTIWATREALSSMDWLLSIFPLESSKFYTKSYQSLYLCHGLLTLQYSSCPPLDVRCLYAGFHSYAHSALHLETSSNCRDKFFRTGRLSDTFFCKWPIYVSLVLSL